MGTIVLEEAWIGFERFSPGSIAPGVSRCVGYLTALLYGLLV